MMDELNARLLALQRQGVEMIGAMETDATFDTIQRAHMETTRPLTVALGALLQSASPFDPDVLHAMRITVETAFVLGYQAGQTSQHLSETDVTWG